MKYLHVKIFMQLCIGGKISKNDAFCVRLDFVCLCTSAIKLSGLFVCLTEWLYKITV